MTISTKISDIWKDGNIITTKESIDEFFYPINTADFLIDNTFLKSHVNL